MKEILKQWKGKFLVDGKILDNIDDVELIDGESFKIKLLAPRNKPLKDVLENNDFDLR